MNRSVNPGFDWARARIVHNPAQYESLCFAQNYQKHLKMNLKCAIMLLYKSEYFHQTFTERGLTRMTVRDIPATAQRLTALFCHTRNSIQAITLVTMV